MCFSVFAVKDIMIEKTENDDVNDFQPLAEHSKALSLIDILHSIHSMPI